MVNLEDITYNNFKIYNNDFLTIWSKEKNKNKYVLLDSFKIELYCTDKIDIWNQLKELYYYNKNENNDIFYNFLIKESELKNEIEV